MQAVWNYCKSNMVCEPDEPKDENEGGDQDEPKKGHGGCGAQQPQIRKEGLKLFVQYKRGKDEDEVCAILAALFSCLIPRRMSSRYSPISVCSRRTRCTPR